MNLNQIASLDENWGEIVSYLYWGLDTMELFVTVVASGEIRERCEPYVQAAKIDNNSIVLEAISDNFSDAPLSPLARDVLNELGWTQPNEENDNHHILLGPGRPSNDLIARFMILTLRDVYGVTPENKFDWTIE